MISTYFLGQPMKSTNFTDKLWIPLISWTRCSASTAKKIHNGVQKSFPRKTTTTTNKSFLRPSQGSLAVKKYIFHIDQSAVKILLPLISQYEERWIYSCGQHYRTLISSRKTFIYDTIIMQATYGNRYKVEIHNLISTLNIFCQFSYGI